LAVQVPADARLIVNGYETKSTGTLREFASSGLKSGYRYQYAIQAQVVRNGQTITANRTVYLQGGLNESVVFDLPLQNKPEQVIASAK
jgi:uncharacterized protein (TIGR03000 family)